MVSPFPTDLAINAAMIQLETPLRVMIMRVFSFFGSTPFIILAGIVAIIFACKKRKFQHAMLLSVAGILGFIIKEIVKEFLQRPRPENSLIALDTFSLPSGHATLSIIFFLWLYQTMSPHIPTKRMRGIVFASVSVMILMVGISRIYLRTHWLSDVLAGWLLGAVVLFASKKWLCKWIEKTS